jgi:hypothetical protein
MEEERTSTKSLRIVSSPRRLVTTTHLKVVTQGRSRETVSCNQTAREFIHRITTKALSTITKQANSKGVSTRFLSHL